MDKNSTKQTGKKATSEEVAKFLEFCEKNLIRFQVNLTVMTVFKNFQAGETEDYIMAESLCQTAIDLIPYSKSQGSIWGTTSDGVGGYSALVRGEMKLNKSGVKKAWLRELSKQIVILQ